jgi:acetaldehyde dehydrogenase
MRNTVMATPAAGVDVDERALRAAVDEMVAEVATYVPGYRLKAPVEIEEQRTPQGRRTVIFVLLEVEGAGDFLPRYSGNLDIMTSAAVRVGQAMAAHSKLAVS